uniref:Uncharacterized protein n=1 Tax=Trichogramma kaykai TaxID=54128 RepID=A0ABD2VY32_9HYME
MMTGRIIEQDRRQRPLKDVFYDRKTAQASFASRRFINERPGPAKFQEATRLINFTFYVRQNTNHQAGPEVEAVKRDF